MASAPVVLVCTAPTVSSNGSTVCHADAWEPLPSSFPSFTQHDFAVIAGPVTAVVLTALVFRLALRLLWGSR